MTSAASYQFGITVDSDWQVGSRYEMHHPSSPGPARRGRDPGGRTRRTGWSRRSGRLWGDDVKSEGTSRVTWEINQIDDTCCLLLTHDQLPEGVNDQIYGGWPMILSGLEDLAGDRGRADDPRAR